jgi:hypothetical protein
MIKIENKKNIYGFLFAISALFCCIAFNNTFNKETYLNRVLISEALVEFGSLNSAEKVVQNLKSKPYQKKVLNSLHLESDSTDYLNAIKAMESAKVLRSNYLELTFEDSKSEESVKLLSLIGQFLAEEQNNRLENNIKLLSKNMMINLHEYSFASDEYARCNAQNDLNSCAYIENRLKQLKNIIIKIEISLLKSFEKARVLEVESIRVEKYSNIMLMTLSVILGYLLGLIFYDLILVGGNFYINFRKSKSKKF